MSNPESIANSAPPNADQLREIGNNALAQRNFELALTSFTRALELEQNGSGSNVVLLCSRSSALAQLGKYDLALDDANKVRYICILYTFIRPFGYLVTFGATRAAREPRGTPTSPPHVVKSWRS